MRAWSATADNKLRSLYKTATREELCFQLKRSFCAIRARANRLGLTRRKYRRWTKPEEVILCRRYPNELTSDIARDLGRDENAVYNKAHDMGLRKSEAFLRSDAYLGLFREQARTHPRMRESQFKKGCVPPNKGIRRPGWGPGRMKETQFRKGMKPQTWVPVGTVVLSADGYWKRKVRDDAPRGMSRKNWVYLHIELWEEHLGPVPPGHCIVFKNGDRNDLRCDNLKCISRRQNMRRNSLHYRYPEEVRAAIHAKAALTRVINTRAKGARP